MLLNLHNYILLLINQQADNFGVAWGDIEQAYSIWQNSFWGTSLPVYNISLTFLLFLPDFLLFCGIIGLIIIFGYYYSKKDQIELFLSLLQFSISISGMVVVLLLIQWVLMVYDINTTLNLFGINFHYFSVVDWYIGYSILGKSIIINIYSQTSKLVIVLIAYFIFLLARTLKSTNMPELLILLYISLTLGVILVSCAHFIILLLTLESFSLLLYILTTIDRARGGIMAAVKYFAFGTLGSVLLLWGVTHMYAIIPLLSYSAINILHIITLNFNIIPGLVESLDFTALLLIVGFLIKLGAAPSHQWVPDVYAGAPFIITMFFATVVKFVMFMIFFRTIIYFNSNVLIDFFAISSLLVGSFLTVQQLEIKRFLAYSSITHVGFILMGDLAASFIYIITYICSSLLLFSIIITTQLYQKELLYLSDLRALKKGGYWGPILLVVSLSSMAGLPPFSGFFGKFLVWGSLLEDIYLYNSLINYLLLILSIIITLIIIFYYIRLLAYIFMSDDNEILPQAIVFEDKSIYSSQLLLLFTITGWVVIQPSFMSIILNICSAAVIT